MPNTVEKEYSYIKYAKQVASKKLVAGKFIRIICQQFLDDLKKKDFKYKFDKEKAENAIDFIQTFRHTKGEYARQKLLFVLEPWQQFIVANLFGWVNKDGYRRYNKLYLEVARKNGKTMLAAAIALVAFFLDGEEGPELYFGATSKDQSDVAYGQTTQIIEKSPFLYKKCKIYNSTKKTLYPGKNGIIRNISSDSKTADGLNPTVAVVDEYHEHKTNKLLGVLQSGMGARKQPLTLITTTAGDDLMKPCYKEERELCVNILEGRVNVENIFPVIYELDEPDKEWTNPKMWVKANPNLGVSVETDFLLKEITEALSSPSKQNGVKTKNLNVWCNSATAWINPEDWKKANAPHDINDFKHRRCYLGLDLSNKLDLTCIAILFPPLQGETNYHLFMKFYLPEEGIDIKSKQDNVSYRQWADDGYLTLTPGEVVDYKFVEEDIKRIAEEFEVVAVAYDPWRAQEITANLEDAGINMIKFDQSLKNMAEPSATFEALVKQGHIQHGGNPILEWNVHCTVIKTDPNGNFKPLKPARGSGKRIDGVVATVMAIALANSNLEPTYNDGEFYVLDL